MEMEDKKQSLIAINNMALQQLASQYKTVNEFRAVLDAVPESKHLKVNKLVSGKPLYLPVDMVINELNTVFSGLWNMRIIKTETIANEFVVTVELDVFHPVIQSWLTRGGIGAAQIRMEKGTEENPTLLTDFNKKIKVALSADAPHALSEALKNAAKKFGRRFGGSLNREDSWLEFQELGDVTLDEAVIQQIVADVASFETEQETRFSFENLDKDTLKDPRVRDAYVMKLAEFKRKARRKDE